MMILRKKTIIGLFLCTLVFSASIPMLLGIQASPDEVFGGEIITLSQVNSTASLSTTLATELNEGENVIASPEIYAFCMVKDYPVIARGVVLDNYLDIEDGEIVKGGNISEDDFVVVGERFAGRAGLDVGDRFVFTGSTRSAIYQFRVDAIYSSPLSSDDILIPLDIARSIAGLGSDYVSTIRVKAENHTALIETLEEKEEPVIISNGGGTSTAVNANVTEEERMQLTLAFKYEPEQFKESGGSFISVFLQEGENSIRIVIVTFIILDAALTFIGATAIIARAIIERRPDIGTLFAIGADRRHIRKLIAKDVLIFSIPASLMGALAGYVIVMFIESSSLLLMFSQTIHPLINWEIMAGICISTTVIFVISGIIINETLMKATPQNMMRDTDDIPGELTVPDLVTMLGVGE